MIRSITKPARGTKTLEADALSVVPQVQRTLRRALASLPQPAGRPRDLVTGLGLHHSLAWKVIRLATGEDPMGNAQFIPGRAGMDLFLTAAAKAGADGQAVAEVREAFARFRAMVESHAGDRPTLDLMLGELASTPEGPADRPALRRAAYLCSSATWGVQVRTRVLAKILHPSAGAGEAGMMDIALVRLFSGMRRVRPDAPLVLSRAVVLDNDGRERRKPVSEALDAEGGGARLLRRFCSDPVPELVATRGADGVIEQRVVGGPVGEQGAVTLCIGEVQRGAASAFADEHNSASRTAVEVRLPMQHLVVDVWAHRSICPDAVARARTYSELGGTPWYRQPPELVHVLPMAERPERIGWGLTSASIADAPEYGEAIAYAFERLGWSPDDHVLHRLRVEFPVLSTAVVLELDLPERPV
jgi:hypothetical protein